MSRIFATLFTIKKNNNNPKRMSEETILHGAYHKMLHFCTKKITKVNHTCHSLTHCCVNHGLLLHLTTSHTKIPQDDFPKLQLRNTDADVVKFILLGFANAYQINNNRNKITRKNNKNNGCSRQKTLRFVGVLKSRGILHVQ